MDFNSALANLQRTANAVRSGGGGGGNSGNDRSSGGSGPPGRGGAGSGGRRERGDGDRFGRGGPPAAGHEYHPRGRGGGGDRDGLFDSSRRRPYEASDRTSGGGASTGSSSTRGPSERGGYYGERPSQRPRLESGGFYHGPGERGGGRAHGPPQRGQRDNLLEPMRRFGYRVEPFRPPRDDDRPEEEGPRPRPRPRHICLLALTIDELPYEAIWRAWANGPVSSDVSQEVYVSLACHAKFPHRVRSDFLRRRLLTRKPVIGRGNSFADPEYASFVPEWGSVQLTRAMISLLLQGMKIGQPRRQSQGGGSGVAAPDPNDDPRFTPSRHVIRPRPPEDVEEGETKLPSSPSSSPSPPPVDAFIFISETCLPVTTLDECVREIFSIGDGLKVDDGVGTGDRPASRATSCPSWVAARNRRTPGTPRNKYEVDQFGDIHRMVPGQYRWKADQWLLLCREHASAVLNVDRHLRPTDQLWNSFVKVSASDEMYFPTIMGVLGIINDDMRDDKNVVRRQVTYVDWSEGMRNPAAYANGVRDLVRVAKLARSNRSLFARKFMTVAPGSDHVTGTISVDEWTDVMSQVTEAEAIAKANAEASTEPGEGKAGTEADTSEQQAAVEETETANGSAVTEKAWADTSEQKAAVEEPETANDSADTEKE